MAEAPKFTGLAAGVVATVDRQSIRQAMELPEGYEKKALSEMTFDPRLVFELGAGLDTPAAIFGGYGIAPEEATKMMKNPVFIEAVKTAKKYVAEHGVTFKTKARLLAEDLLEHAYQMATSTETPASVRAELIQWVTRMGGLEPPKEGGDRGTGGGLMLNFVFQDGTKTVVVEQPKQAEGDKNG